MYGSANAHVDPYILIFRYYMTNYNGTLLSNFGGGFFHGQFNNYTSITAFVGMGPETKSDQVLWGGPLVVSPAGYYAYFNFSTNGQKIWYLELVTMEAGIALEIKRNPQALIYLIKWATNWD